MLCAPCQLKTVVVCVLNYFTSWITMLQGGLYIERYSDSLESVWALSRYEPFVTFTCRVSLLDLVIPSHACLQSVALYTDDSNICWWVHTAHHSPIVFRCGDSGEHALCFPSGFSRGKLLENLPPTLSETRPEQMNRRTDEQTNKKIPRLSHLKHINNHLNLISPALSDTTTLTWLAQHWATRPL